MHPGIVAAPFSIIASVLSDTNATDIAQVFNASNVTTSGNFTLEPSIFLFVNYLKQQKECADDSASNSNRTSGVSALHLGPGPVILSGSQASSVFGLTSLPSSSSSVSTFGVSPMEDNTLTSTSSAPSGTTDATSNSTDGSVAGNTISDGSVSVYDAMTLYNTSTAMQLHINMSLPRPVAKSMPLFAVNGTYDASQAFVVGVFNLGNSTFNGSAHAQYIGANFTAQNISVGGSELSLLTNSSDALIEYWRPSKKYSGTDDQRLVFLIWNQTAKFNNTFANSSSSNSSAGSSSSSALGEGPTAGNWTTFVKSSTSASGSSTTGLSSSTSLDLGNGPTAGNWSTVTGSSTGNGLSGTGTATSITSSSTDTLTSETDLSASNNVSAMSLSNMTASRFEFSISEFIELSGLGQPIGDSSNWTTGTSHPDSAASGDGDFAPTCTGSGLSETSSTASPCSGAGTTGIMGASVSSKLSPTTIYVTNY